MITTSLQSMAAGPFLSFSQMQVLVWLARPTQVGALSAKER